ncbi:ribosome biogenesis GTP-binding protein YsxC [Allomyces macrogynus ATCC 38327]|uniref:Ribosome biogenesis GTP-binding protein YsxC n=1 Tax=Allomyces macrogynus (strain ATCC 38327) TaxID=578462 RepID=A0A0L0SN37_ALLM3|nr:ribosome biogenesis GTP-binding protein YsxC [Allomyces macrogynus ATCC 38327]|eukprot:KNE63795.1 ribosome biogenesis GTP-binding protein YsxC [Allomyces macrogynus ATCC 38327]
MLRHSLSIPALGAAHASRAPTAIPATRCCVAAAIRSASTTTSTRGRPPPTHPARQAKIAAAAAKRREQHEQRMTAAASKSASASASAVTAKSAAQAAAELSKRKQFMSITPRSDVLDLIQSWGLGENKRPTVNPDKYPLVAHAKRPVEFVAAAKREGSFWKNEERWPEIAMIGRSNVGKSRLINAVCGTTIVRVKAKPGLTQSINWYKVAKPLRGYVVDMPGYGFAYAKDERKEGWSEIIPEYLKRPQVSRLLVLVDARHGLKMADVEFLDSISRLRRLPKSIILTKCDLVRPDILARRYQSVCQDVHKFGIQPSNVVMVSAKSGAGLIPLRTLLKRELMTTAEAEAAAGQ